MAILLVAVLFCSCVSNDIEGAGAVNVVKRAEIIDYKGAAMGASIPGWALDAIDGNKRAVQAGLGLQGRKLWILQNSGDDLDFLKLWTEQVDARAEIASGIEQTIADLVTAEMTAREADEFEKERQVSRFSSRVTSITLGGLEKEADYWTLTRRVKEGVKKAQSEDDYIVQYTYVVVFSMDEKLWDTQIDAAFSDVGDNDDQAEELRQIVTSKLKEKLLGEDEVAAE